MSYINSSYIRDIDNQASITKYYFFFRKALLTRYSKRQQIVLTLTSKFKYVATSHRVRERVWIYKFINELLSE